jgi:hypothetical protein
MKITRFSLALVAGFALLSSSAFGQFITYTANNTPGTSNDSLVNSGPTTTQVWTLATTGNSTSEATATISGSKVWAIDARSDTSTITQTTSFQDGALQHDQSVSIKYGMSNEVDSGGKVGLNLLSGSTTEVSVFFAGGQSYFEYTDSTHSAVSTGQYYNPSSLMTFSFEITGTGTYSADLNGNTFTGTFSAPITGIQVFDDDGGGSGIGSQYTSTEYSTDLVESVPEPATYAMVALALGALLLMVRPRSESV